jgi:hypothetical protein
MSLRSAWDVSIHFALTSQAAFGDCQFTYTAIIVFPPMMNLDPSSLHGKATWIPNVAQGNLGSGARSLKVSDHILNSTFQYIVHKEDCERLITHE